MAFGNWINSITGVINQAIAPTGAQIKPVEEWNVTKNTDEIVEKINQVVSGTNGNELATTIMPNPQNPSENIVVDNSKKGSLTDKLLNNSIMEPLTSEIKKETPKEEDGQTMSIDYDKINEIVENANKRQDELRTKMWEREDKIRAETQAREDTAYQRAVEDMRKAGINPNLINVSPAQSGSGITQASKAQETTSQEINNAYQMILNAINNEKDIEENQKDRLNSLVTTALHMYLLGKFVK